MTLNLKIPAAECALLVIDMQNGFVHPDSAMGKSPAGTSAQQQIVPPIEKLVSFCRGKKIPVLWSLQEHFPGDVTRSRRKILPHSARQGFLPCLRGTWETELFEGIRSSLGPADHLVPKHRASAFYNTNLETKLRMLGTHFLFITGCNTEFCVESTVRDAYARDFELLMIQDCLAGINARFHESSLEKFQAYFGEVIRSEELLGIVE